MVAAHVTYYPGNYGKPRRKPQPLQSVPRPIFETGTCRLQVRTITAYMNLVVQIPASILSSDIVKIGHNDFRDNYGRHDSAARYWACATIATGRPCHLHLAFPPWPTLQSTAPNRKQCAQTHCRSCLRVFKPGHSQLNAQ